MPKKTEMEERVAEMLEEWGASLSMAQRRVLMQRDLFRLRRKIMKLLAEED